MNIIIIIIIEKSRSDLEGKGINAMDINLRPVHNMMQGPCIALHQACETRKYSNFHDFS